VISIACVVTVRESEPNRSSLVYDEHGTLFPEIHKQRMGRLVAFRDSRLFPFMVTNLPISAEGRA
jgi:hypothetical protein